MIYQCGLLATPASAKVAIPVWQAKRRAQDRDRQRRARALAEPHAEIEQRLELELVEQHSVRGLGRHMRGLRMIERVGAELRQRRGRGGADEAVEQHRNAAVARGERGAEDGGKLAAAERRCDQERIAQNAGMPGERLVDCGPLARKTLVVDAGAAAAHRAPSPPNRPAAMAAAAVVLPIPISPRQIRSASGRTASYPAATAARNEASSIAGSRVKSAVGFSRSSGVTRSVADTACASWLIAAPPEEKFATICAVTAAGKGDTPCAVTP